jgi:hypothetical protein
MGRKKPRAGRADAGQNSALGLGGKLSAPSNQNTAAQTLFRSKTIFFKKSFAAGEFAQVDTIIVG